MGRFTDDIMAAFGIKPSDRVPVINPTSGITGQGTPQGTGEDAEKDCFECKVVGTSLFGGLSLYGLTLTQQRYKEYHGRQRAAYVVLGVSLSTSLMLLAVSRAFNIGLFGMKENESLKQIFKKESQDFFTFINVTPPEFLNESKDEHKTDV